MRNRLVRRGAIVAVLSTAYLFAGCNSDNSAKENLNTGYQALDARNYDEAIVRADQQLGQTSDGETKAEALYLKGRALEQKTVASNADGRRAMIEAHDAYSQALQQQPGPVLIPLLHAGLANTSYHVDDYSPALQEWQTAYPSFQDASVKSFMLYRIGLCQQRLGQFAVADQTFATVQQQYPETDGARRAREHQGYKAFSVQLATYANSTLADAAISAVRRQGATPTKSVDALGHTIVSIGPFASYSQAADIRGRMSGSYPQAIIVP